MLSEGGAGSQLCHKLHHKLHNQHQQRIVCCTEAKGMYQKQLNEQKSIYRPSRSTLGSVTRSTVEKNFL